FRNHLAIHADAFAKRDKVRGREQAGAISLCPADRIDHGANRAFAVRSRDVNDLECTSARCVGRRAFAAANAATTFVEQSLDVFQAELYPEALKAVEPGKRLTIIDRRVC